MAAAASLPYLILRRFVVVQGQRPVAAAKRPLLLCKTTPFLSSIGLSTSAVGSVEREVVLLGNSEIESESEEPATLSTVRNRGVGASPPSLSVKEKKDLASYAHSLGKKLKSQQVGKLGVTDTVVGAMIESLEANELLKLKIHDTCPGELDDVVKQLEETTGSVVVGRIGRTVILYRPSITKLKEEAEKGRRARRTLMTRQRSMQSRRASGETQGREPRRKPGRRSGRFRANA